MEHLSQLVAFLAGEQALDPLTHDPPPLADPAVDGDLADVRGQPDSPSTSPLSSIWVRNRQPALRFLCSFFPSRGVTGAHISEDASNLSRGAMNSGRIRHLSALRQGSVFHRDCLEAHTWHGGHPEETIFWSFFWFFALPRETRTKMTAAPQARFG